MYIVLYICFYLWFIFGLIGFATNMSISAEGQSQLMADVRWWANAAFIASALLSSGFLLTAMFHKKRIENKRCEKSLVHMLLRNHYELPVAEFLMLNKNDRSEASDFIEKRIKKFPDKPKSGGKLYITDHMLRYSFYDKRGVRLKIEKALPPILTKNKGGKINRKKKK